MVLPRTENYGDFVEETLEANKINDNSYYDPSNQDKL